MTGASNDNSPPLDGLVAAAQSAQAKSGRGPPPVHLWNPPNCGDIDIRIARDGLWFHEKTPIGREALVFQTNVGDEVIADAEHELRVTWNAETGEPAPYLHVRRGLLARLSRPVFYELVESAEVRDTPEGPTWGVRSNGAWFAIAPPGAGL